MAHPGKVQYPDGRVPHLNLKEGDVAKYVLLPGSPERARLTASMIDEAVEKAFHREYLTFTGSYKDVDVTVMSTGMGCFSAITAVEELAAIGADTFIRIGSCATYQKDIDLGNNIIATGCIRDEGCTLELAPIAFPAVPNLDVLQALISSAKDNNATFHTGIVRTCQNFYSRDRSPKLNEQYTKLGAVALEMELSAILIAATELGRRAGGILTVGSNLVTTENRYKGQRVDEFEKGERDMIKVALEAVKRLHSQ
ncbi:MAG: nucleoside phosphorylase [Candidatus Thorarchaeota archaeon]|jgi:uridine phosphorylase